MKQKIIIFILALTANFVTAQIVADADDTAAKLGITSKVLPSKKASSVAHNGNADTNHDFPNVKITNAVTMSVDGTRFVKFKQFGFVFNYPSRDMRLYWVHGTKKRLDYDTSPIKLFPLLNGAKRFYESFYINGVGECKFYYDGDTGNVVGYTLEHWDFPDASGQMVTREGITTEY